MNSLLQQQQQQNNGGAKKILNTINVYLLLLLLTPPDAEKWDAFSSALEDSSLSRRARYVKFISMHGRRSGQSSSSSSSSAHPERKLHWRAKFGQIRILLLLHLNHNGSSQSRALHTKKRTAAKKKSSVKQQQRQKKTVSRMTK